MRDALQGPADDAQRASFLLDVANSQERVLFLIERRAWEGYVESCVMGTVVAVIRLAGTRDAFIRREVALTSIRDMVRVEPSKGGTEDPLLARARELVAQAHMSLAERLVMQRTRPHTGGDDA